MIDINDREIMVGNHVKYSFNAIKVPVFTGVIVEKENDLYIEHSNKITIKLDTSIRYIEILTYNVG